MRDNYYQILQIPYNAKREEISKAYKKLASIYHPDNKKTGNTEIFVKIVDAYSTLSNPEEKIKYDTQLLLERREKLNKKTTRANNTDNFEDRLDYIKTKLYDLFNKKGENLKEDTFKKRKRKVELHKIKITFAESILGSLRYIYTKKQYLCNKCKGKGGESKFERCVQCGGLGVIGSKVTVYIKPYTQNDKIISINGMDIKIQVIIINNHHYALDSKNRVIMNVPITLSESIEGCNIEILSPNLNLLKLTIPSKTRSGSLLKIVNKREKDIDFYVKVYTHMPPHITPIELSELKKIEAKIYKEDIRKRLKNL